MDSRWILKGLVESVLVVGSILLALAVDEWAQNREYAELADQSLGTFEREIRQNRERLQGEAPYHMGIRDLLGQMRSMPESRMEIASILEGLTPPVLLDTAWQTALATGALTHMDFEVVSALSLTYSIQEDFESRIRSNRPRITASQNLQPGEAGVQLDEAYEYVSTLSEGESELMAVYEQALEMIGLYRMTDHVDAASDSTVSGAGSPRRSGAVR